MADINSMNLVESERLLLTQVKESRLQERRLLLSDIAKLDEDEVHKLALGILVHHQDIMETVGRINWLLDNPHHA